MDRVYAIHDEHLFVAVDQLDPKPATPTCH
jgi:hypothetical protein